MQIQIIQIKETNINESKLIRIISCNNNSIPAVKYGAGNIMLGESLETWGIGAISKTDGIMRKEFYVEILM